MAEWRPAGSVCDPIGSDPLAEVRFEASVLLIAQHGLCLLALILDRDTVRRGRGQSRLGRIRATPATARARAGRTSSLPQARCRSQGKPPRWYRQDSAALLPLPWGVFPAL